MQPGVYQQTNEEYHSGPGISSSGLKIIDQSLLHFWEQYRNPDHEEKDDSKALIIGSAVHCAVLEPDDFPYRYVIVPEGIDRRSKAGKEFFAEIEAEGKTPLSQDDYKHVTRTSQALRVHPAGAHILGLRGKVETALYWIDPATGVLCKCKPDYMIEPCKALPNGLILDLKSTVDASPAGFAKQAYNFGYHISAAFYCDGFQQVFGTKQPPAFIFGAVEKEPPYACAYYSASDDQITLGRYHAARLLQQYAAADAADTWPGYSREISPLALPTWAQRELNEIIGRE